MTNKSFFRALHIITITSLLAIAVGAQTSTQSPTVEGFWQGALEAGGVKLRLVIKISRKPDQTWTGTLDSVDQGAKDIPLTMVTFQDGKLHVEMKTIGASYDGTLASDGNELSGEFNQGAKLPLDFKRMAHADDAVLKRPQTPVKPYPYAEQDVSYQNTQDKITLAGTLTTPRGTGPFPAVVLITGSGAQDRNEMLLGHQPFLVLADYLTRRGIAVLRLDDRGVGGTSKGTPNDTSQNYVSDVLAGVAFLKTRKEINPKQIGLIGHSEGGMIAPMAAARSTDIAFIVLMAGPGIPGDELLAKQTGLISAAECENQAQEVEAANARRFAIVKEEKDPAIARQKLDADRAKSEERARKKLESQIAAAKAQADVLLSPWFRFFLSYDPRPTLAKVKVPVLAMNGEVDVQVPAKADLAAIGQALKEAGNRDYKIVLLPKLNHLFQTSTTGAPSEYGSIEETIAPIALQTMGDWIVAHTSAAPRQ